MLRFKRLADDLIELVTAYGEGELAPEQRSEIRAEQMRGSCPLAVHFTYESRLG